MRNYYKGRSVQNASIRIAILAAASLSSAALCAANDPPAPSDLAVTLTPSGQRNGLDRLGVTMRIPAPNTGAGSPLLKMPTKLVGLDTAGYAAAAIEAVDDRGPLPLGQRDEPPGPSGTYRDYVAQRATVGDVTVRFATAPRTVDKDTRNGPLFDLRAQGGGLIGAGVYFFAIPVGSSPYRIHLHWDFSKSPPGTRGIWSFGEGDQTTVAPAEVLEFSFYATGPVKSDPTDKAGRFGFYYLAQPPFDPVTFGERTHRLYDYMAKFFQDTSDDGYRVFARGNPYPSGGGTSLGHSFMFGYGPDGQSIGDGFDMLVAHEMAHTWPGFSNEDDHPATAWYSEGTAEYYSVLLSKRAGTIDLDRFLTIINAHARGYYTNPYRELSNEAAGRLFWSDAMAQRVPYGRGFMYLAALNAQLIARSGDRKSVDDLVLEVLKRQRAGEKIDNPQWIDIVVRELGPQAKQDYLDMVAGKTIVPNGDSFGPCFSIEKVSLRPFDLGFDDMRLAVVKNLKPNSPAALAGLREGDDIVSITPLAKLQENPASIAEVTVSRAGQSSVIRFSPHRDPVEGWQWKRRAGVPDSACGL